MKTLRETDRVQSWCYQHHALCTFRVSYVGQGNAVTAREWEARSHSRISWPADFTDDHGYEGRRWGRIISHASVGQPS